MAINSPSYQLRQYLAMGLLALSTRLHVQSGLSVEAVRLSFFFPSFSLLCVRAHAPCHRLCLTLYLLRHSYYLDRGEQDLGCKSRNFPAALTLGACLPLCRPRDRLRRTFCHATEFS